ncbi:hypothetical protein HZA97_06535 [Candidatus Woesearchaeota archaeon]|nr:hypothetical protein [Candidatus Woesearchaeota archaeon]
MVTNLYDLGKEVQNLGQILELIESLYGLALPIHNPKTTEKTQNNASLEGITGSPVEDFYQDSMEYFLSRGRNFAKYLRVVLGRDVTTVVGAKIKQLEENNYFQLETEEEGCYMVKSSSVDWDKSIDFFAQQYKVSFSAMKEYLLMHEHAHASQKGMTPESIARERDVEELVLKYSTAMSVTNPEQEQFYDDIASVARQRLGEVERHYGEQQ